MSDALLLSVPIFWLPLEAALITATKTLSQTPFRDTYAINSKQPKLDKPAANYGSADYSPLPDTPQGIQPQV